MLGDQRWALSAGALGVQAGSPADELDMEEVRLLIEPIMLMIKLYYCSREQQNLTPCWICFFYFNLCFSLLLLL